MDAAIYARLSKNRRGLSDNVEIQIAESEGYATDKLWSVVLVTSDDDISASKFSNKARPGYDQLIAAIKAGQVEVIICTEMSRLYRKLEELLELIKLAEHTRLRGIWTTDDIGYDLSTPEGVHSAIGAVNNAILESAKLSRRQKRKKEAQARQGKPSGGGRPFGYEADGLTLKADEVAILIEAKDRYLSGDTVRDLVRDFYHRGIVSPYGKPWAVENFQRVLFSKRYLGIRVHNDAEYPALWPAIFTQDEWDRMNARRLARATMWPGRGRGVGRKYLLTGLLYCGNCHQYMIGSKTKRRGELVRRYRCRHYDNYGQLVGCGRVFRMADPLEAFITEAVLYRLDSPQVAAALTQTDENGLDELLAEYQSARTRLDQMTTDYASGFLSREEYAVAKRVAEDAVEAAREALGRVQTRPTEVPAPEVIRQVWDEAGLDWKHSVIRLLVDRILVLPGSPGSHEWRGWRFDPNRIEISWLV